MKTTRENFKDFVQKKLGNHIDEQTALAYDFYAIDEMADFLAIVYNDLNPSAKISSDDAWDILSEDFGYDDAFFKKVNEIANAKEN